MHSEDYEAVITGQREMIEKLAGECAEAIYKAERLACDLRREQERVKSTVEWADGLVMLVNDLKAEVKRLKGE